MIILILLSGSGVYLYYSACPLYPSVQAKGSQKAQYSLNQIMQIVAESKPQNGQAEASVVEVDLDQILKRNDACEFIRRYVDIASFYTNEQLTKRLPEKEVEGINIKLLLKGGPQKSGQEIGTFFNALLHGGLLVGAERPDVFDPEESIRLFEELRSQDPQNGIYSFYLSALRENDVEAIEDLKQAFAATKIQSHMTTISRGVLTLSKEDHAHFLLGTLINSTLPMPDYIRPFKRALKLIKENPELRPMSLEFGKLLMKEGNEKGPTGREFVDWLAIEYNIGQRFFKNVWDQKTPLPAEYAKSYKQFFRVDENKEVWDKAAGSGPCPKEGLEEMFLKEKRSLNL